MVGYVITGNQNIFINENRTSRGEQTSGATTALTHNTDSGSVLGPEPSRESTSEVGLTKDNTFYVFECVPGVLYCTCK